MAKRTKKNVFEAHYSKPESPMEKTTRIVRKMVNEDAEKRQAKISRLRNARLEREASTPSPTTATAARKTRQS